MPLIKMQKIRKSYDTGGSKLDVLRGIDLEIERGEFVAIMGPSGSGKSTLMHIIGFLDRPSGGKYFFEDDDVTNLTDDELAEIRNRKVGFVFQAFNLLARTSAMDNVALPMLYSGVHNSEEMQRRAMHLLRQVGLENRAEHSPSELSGGQQQRVAIARSLVNDPAVIFADEPTGNLDTKSSVEIMTLFQQLNDQGRTLIFVTHEESIAEYAKRVIKISDGEIVSDHKHRH